MHSIELDGCTATPLAHYLKGLGVFRLVAEQEDPAARLAWRGDRPVLHSTLDRPGLLDFLLHRYRPTPMVSPWNGGSGFYDGDRRQGMDAILDTDRDRFALYRRVIRAVWQLPELPDPAQTVGDLLDKLEREIANARPGKKRREREEHVRKVTECLDPAAEALGQRVDRHSPLKELEARARGSGRPAAVKALWNALSKARSECKRIDRAANKKALIAGCRRELPDEAVEWLDAAIALTRTGDPDYNPVLGTGGLDGRLELSNNYMSRLAGLLIKPDPNAASWLESALFGEPCDGLPLRNKIGQYDPGRAGGSNQGEGVDQKKVSSNSWDLVLLLEGALLLAAAVTRRGDPWAKTLGALPFTVRVTGVGFTSGHAEEQGRAELWLPTWQQPVGLAELRQLFAEGRADLGRRPARNGLDFARAVGSLGVDRGLEAFYRYVFLRRRGDAYVALPAGRISVRARPPVRLLDQLDAPLRQVDAFLRAFTKKKKKVPADLASARRQVDEQMYRCAVDPSSAAFQALLRAVGRLERYLARRDPDRDPRLSRPVAGLGVEWILQADDGSPEVRLAAALASVAGSSDHKVGPMRAHLAPVDPEKPWQWARGGGQRAWQGSDLAERLGSALERRLRDAERTGQPGLPLSGRVAAWSRDLVRFMMGHTQDTVLEELLFAFTWIRSWRGAERVNARWSAPLEDLPLPREYALLALLHGPPEVRGQDVPLDPRIIGALRAGHTARACDQAVLRLRVLGASPWPVRYESRLRAERLLAALLVPIRDAHALGRLVLRPLSEGSAEPEPDPDSEIDPETAIS